MKMKIPVRLLALLVFLIAFSVLLPGVAPHISSGDSGELALAGETLGVPHSPGYPVFSMVHYAASRFLFFGNAAYQQNLIACLLLSAAIALLGVLCALITGRRETVLVPLLLLAAPHVRHLAWVTEVFPLTVLWATLIYLAVLRFHRRRSGVFLISFLVGIGIAVHQTLILMVPCLFLFLRWNRARAFGGLWRDALPITAFFLLGLSVHLYLPFRSFGEPFLDWEDPETLSRFWGVVTRQRYGFFQLAQGQEGLGSLSGFWNAARHARDVFVENLGWIGVGLVVIGSLASLARRVHRRWLVVTWLHVVLTGPVFFWLARANPETAGGLLERFSALPLIGAMILVAVASATLLSSDVKMYRLFLAGIVAVLVAERAFAHPFATVRAEWLRFSRPGPVGSLRWDLSIRESAMNMLRMVPPEALLIADRADESEFSLAYLLHGERRRPDVRFVDANAGVTRSVYGDDYYRIWGAPRLARRETVEEALVLSHPGPVVYATLDPTMIDVYRTHRGILFRAWPLERVEDPSGFPWAAMAVWRFPSREVRGASFLRTNLDLLGQSSYERGHGAWAEKCFGLAQLVGGGNRFEKLGYWHQMRGKTTDARRCYQKAMSQGVISESLFINRGALEMEAGRGLEAIAIYQQGLRHFPDSTGLLYNLAVVHWREGRRGAARPFLTRVVELEPQHVEALRLLRDLNGGRPQ